ncbi:MAG TPA: hypothetical protein VN193_16860 [Candidatus Angelobacter sp.]|jgi:hypothetical protein|nr:hypothetical protein [Candidatus Angelobacter sp.]
MNPMLTEALVAPRLDDLRRSARNSANARDARQPVRPVPVPMWTRTLAAPGASASLAAEPVATGCGDAA